MDQHEEAIRDFSSVLQLESNNISALYNRGSAYDSLLQHDLAAADFMKAMEIDGKAQPVT